MKLKLLIEHESTLEKLNTLSLPNAQTAWDLSEAIERARGHVKRFNEKRDTLVKKMGVADKAAPGKFQIPDIPAFNREMEKMADVDVVMKFPTITIAMLNGDGYSPAEIHGWRALKILTKN